ncbi:MAG: hypothetical protein KGQ59_01280 [Bdellovibrionales bacterium]|nr:hypothetical protein [Bdellovibrionales bacterium]
MKSPLDPRTLHDLNSAISRLELFLSLLKVPEADEEKTSFEEMRNSARSAVSTIKTHYLSNLEEAEKKGD